MLDVHFNSLSDLPLNTHLPTKKKLSYNWSKQVFPLYYHSVSHYHCTTTLDIIQILNKKDRCKINKDFLSLQANVIEYNLYCTVTCYTYDHFLTPLYPHQLKRRI